MKAIEELKIGDCTIRLIQGDITELEVDAIVNAANTSLIMGGGVAGAISRKGGPEIQQECYKIGGTFVGGAVITTGGNLKARYVIHAVGPRMGEGNEEEKLRNATINSLKIMLERRLDSIAFPAISTGIFGYPVDKCSQIMLSSTISFLKEHKAPREVVFCLYSAESYKVFVETLNSLKTDTES